MFKKILFPTSGSPNATKVAKAIVDLAKGYDTHVIIAYAVPLKPGFVPEITKQLDENGIDLALSAIDGLVERLTEVVLILKENQISYEVKMEYGNPTDTMCRLATEEKASVMVVGHHGQSKLSDFLFNDNIMIRLINHAPCPVLVIK